MACLAKMEPFHDCQAATSCLCSSRRRSRVDTWPRQQQRGGSALSKIWPRKGQDRPTKLHSKSRRRRLEILAYFRPAAVEWKCPPRLAEAEEVSSQLWTGDKFTHIPFNSPLVILVHHYIPVISHQSPMNILSFVIRWFLLLGTTELLVEGHRFGVNK